MQAFSHLFVHVCLLYTGFRWDRQWMVINNNGRAYTQRNEPKLALVETELPNEAFLEGWEPTGRSFMGNSSSSILQHNFSEITVVI